MMDSKKKVIVYGNCHTSAIINILHNYQAFCDNYYIYDIPQIQSIKDADFFASDNILSDCDVFIHQSIQLNNRYGENYASENIVKLLKPECKVVAIPNVYQMPKCFFPQYKEADELRSLLRNRTRFFRDDIIDKGYAQRKSVDEIVERYEYGSAYDKEVIKSAYGKFIDKVRNRENDWDIKISEFIDNNYKENQLFYDPNHPTNFLLEYIAYKLLEILLPDIDVKYEEIIGSCTIRLDSYEMPMCESVKVALGLNYQEKELRVTGVKEKLEKMYLKEYINQYISREWRNGEIAFVLRIKSFFKWCLMYVQRIIQCLLIMIR